MTRLIYAFILCFFVSVPAFAAVYNIDPTHTRAEYRVSHMGFSKMPGRFSDINGTIDFDSRDVSKAKVSVIINVLSVSMDNEALDKKLKGAQFFNASKYPLMTFVSKTVEKTGFDRGTVTGDLTLLGVTKPVTLKVKFNKQGYNKYAGAEQIGFTAWGKINRSDFGMKAYLPDVGDEVILRFEVEAMQKKIDPEFMKPSDIVGGVQLPAKE